MAKYDSDYGVLCPDFTHHSVQKRLFKYVQVQLDICGALHHMEAFKHIAGNESSGMSKAKLPCVFALQTS